MASDLAEDLKALQIQKEALEQRNKLLEAALLKKGLEQQGDLLAVGQSIADKVC